MKLASSVEVAVAVKCDKKLKIAHRGLDGRATAIIPRRFCAPIAVRGVRCYINTTFRGMVCTHNFCSYIFRGTSFIAFTHILGFIASLLSYIIDQRYRISLIERNFILLRGNLSHIISTKIVSSAYNFQNLIWYKKVIVNIYYRKILP